MVNAKQLIRSQAVAGAFVCAGALISTQSGAAVLALYDGAGDETSGYNASSSATGVTASDLTSAPYTGNEYRYLNTFGPTDSLPTVTNISGTADNSDVPAASFPGYNMRNMTGMSDFDDSVYIEFSLAPELGSTLDLDTITFRGGRSSDTSVRAYRVGYSLDGGTTFNVAGERVMLIEETPEANEFLAESYDLTAAGSDAVTGPVIFRFYGYIDGGGGNIRVDNIGVNGSVSAVPEPGTIALTGLAATMILARRRRA